MKEAKSIQTLLQSGALPVKVKIVGVSSVSAELGDQFIHGALIAGLLALVVISGIIMLKYRKIILIVPIMLTSIAELILILGTAAVIHWNIDLAAIAGIIAAIGTGVDDQIIITDEVLKGFKEKKNRRSTVSDKKGFLCHICCCRYSCRSHATTSIHWV